jgi:Leucine-rich repeat (LRR) protein
MKEKILNEMKVLNVTLGIILFGLVIGSCIKNEDDPLEDLTEQEQEVIIRTDPVDKVLFSMESEGVTVDWGDGSETEEYDVLHFGTELKHAYNSKGAWTITICAKKIIVLECHENNLSALDVRRCPALTMLDCYDNQLTELDVSNCPALARLRCYNNQLTELNVNGCSALTMLYCYRNNLTALNVSGCSALKSLYCYSNKLTALNVNGCSALTRLECANNQLTELNVSGCTALIYLYCQNNSLSASALNAMFESLPYSNGSLYISYNPGTNTCNRSIATGKGWYVSGYY